jgi:hypothetical protein
LISYEAVQLFMHSIDPALTQSISFKASSIFFGSMDDTNEKCSQNDANLDLVCIPLEISLIIVSNG